MEDNKNIENVPVEIAPEEIEQHQQKEQEVKIKKVKKKLKKPKLGIIFLALTIAIVVIGIVLFIKGIGNAAVAAANAYDDSKNEKIEQVHDEIYNEAYENAEEYYHISNKITISIGDLQKRANLEVLELTDSEFVIKNKGEDSSNITAWLRVDGKGIYSIDMTSSEFITDSEREYVLVRVPNPTLKITVTDREKLLYENGSFLFFNGTEKEGDELREKQEEKGYEMIIDELSSNQQYYDSAKESSKKIITNLVKGLNPDLDNLRVDVEFFK